MPIFWALLRLSDAALTPFRRLPPHSFSMSAVRCPCCGAILRAKANDAWEVVRTFVAVHLRKCDKAPADDKEIRTLAIRVADEVIQGRS